MLLRLGGEFPLILDQLVLEIEAYYCDGKSAYCSIGECILQYGRVSTAARGRVHTVVRGRVSTASRDGVHTK